MKAVSLQVKLSLLGAGLGIALIGILAAYFRRRPRRRPWRDIPTENAEDIADGVTVVSGSGLTRSVRSPVISRVQNGDVGTRRSLTPTFQIMSGGAESLSSLDETASMASTIVNTNNIAQCKPEQLCELGMRDMKMAIDHWEEALEKIDNMDEVDNVTEDLQYQISELLERAYKIQEAYESKLFKTYSTNVAMDAAIQEMDREYEERKRRSARSLRSLDESSSDVDSFISALSFADISDLEEQKQYHRHLAFFEAALLELEHGCIPCRTLRTKMLGCHSDTEFLAKLYCVRHAFQELFKDESVRNYFADCGRQMISELLVKADRDPEEFEQEYKSMLDWVQKAENFEAMTDELRARGVKMMTFYDIVIDFILLDAFDDLANPPSSVVSVVNNRWLSNGFKESALATAVWSVLKAKKRMLKQPKGFIAHFYAVSEHTSPVMAWGFLGPDTGSNLKQLCNIFKDAVLSFMKDVFSFEKVRFTTVEQLTEDILVLARQKINHTMQALSS